MKVFNLFKWEYVKSNECGCDIWLDYVMYLFFLSCNVVIELVLINIYSWVKSGRNGSYL